MQTHNLPSYLATVGGSALSAAVLQMEIGPHLAQSLIGIANIVAAAIVGYYLRKAAGTRPAKKPVSRQRRKKL